jgi:hypothetical protein
MNDETEGIDTMMQRQTLAQLPSLKDRSGRAIQLKADVHDSPYRRKRLGMHGSISSHMRTTELKNVTKSQGTRSLIRKAFKGVSLQKLGFGDQGL